MARSAATKKKNGQQIRIAVDIGGTFTDGVAELAPHGYIWVAKRLTTPDDPGRAVSEVTNDLIAQIEGIDGDIAAQVGEVVHGTTLVTNTIIERNGAKIGLLVTRGTGDTLSIGREFRYDLYDLELELPQPLVGKGECFEMGGRLDARGAEVEPIDMADLVRQIEKLRKKKVEAVAVCLLHSYANDAHERAVAAAMKEHFPEAHVSLSSDVAREIREFERMSTATANAFVQPLMVRYLQQLEGRLDSIGIDAPLRIMVSSGGFTSSKAAAEIPILLLESGPAGGVLSAVNTAVQAGIEDVLAFDMGGTTAKACVATKGEPALAHQFEAGRVRRFKKGSGLPILIPSIDLIEIGAGGGSIAHVNQLGLLNVGPQSSGAVPGPASYGQGGRDATVTDADLMLGFLDPDNFLGGEMKLRTDLAEAAIGRLAEKLGMNPIDVAWGITNLVNENMAGAARVHIAEKGLDPRRFTMVATGGAGPVHVVEVANKLQIKHIMCTIAAGAGSCLGLLAAPARVDRSWSKVQLVDDIDWDEVKSVLETQHKEASAELGSAGARGERIEWSVGIEVRYAGQGNTVQISLPYRDVGPAMAKRIIAAFEKRYAQLYGRTVPDAVAQVVTWRLTGRSKAQSRDFRFTADRVGKGKAKPTGMRRMYLPAKGEFGEVPVYERYSLPAGTKLPGPLVLSERESTVIVARPAAVEILDNLTVSITLK